MFHTYEHEHTTADDALAIKLGGSYGMRRLPRIRQCRACAPWFVRLHGPFRSQRKALSVARRLRDAEGEPRPVRYWRDATGARTRMGRGGGWYVGVSTKAKEGMRCSSAK